MGGCVWLAALCEHFCRVPPLSCEHLCRFHPLREHLCRFSPLREYLCLLLAEKPDISAHRYTQNRQKCSHKAQRARRSTATRPNAPENKTRPAHSPQPTPKCCCARGASCASTYLMPSSMFAPGIAASRLRVYSWVGLSKTSVVVACSTICPCCITHTRSAMRRTTARSCVMKR